MDLIVCADWRTITKEGETKYQIYFSPEFYIWFQTLPPKTRALVFGRLERMRQGHWGFVNRFDGLIELKWTSGLRIYTAMIEESKILVILGGNKNGQKKDIKKAKKIFLRGID